MAGNLQSYFGNHSKNFFLEIWKIEYIIKRVNVTRITLPRGNPCEDFIHLLPIIYPHICICTHIYTHTYILMKLRDYKLYIIMFEVFCLFYFLCSIISD